MVTIRIIEIIVVTVTLVLEEGARVPFLLLLLRPIPVVVVDNDEAHLLLCFGTIISRMLFSSAYFAPRISFDSLCGCVRLNDLLFLLGTFFYLFHQEVHFSGEHVHLIEGMDTSLLGLEAFLIPSLICDHLFYEVFGILDIVLQECSSSGSIKVTPGQTGQAMVETLNEKPFFYPMMRTGVNVLLEMFLCFENRLISFLLEARDLSTKGTDFAHWEELLEKRIGALLPGGDFTLIGVEPLLRLSQ